MKSSLFTFTLIILFSSFSFSQKKDKVPSNTSEQLNSTTFSGMKFRNVGPAFTSGRVADIAVNSKNPFEYYIAVASGGVWKTKNNGNTYEPIFDNENSYSIGYIAISPTNENLIWIGSGENNNQRSVAYKLVLGLIKILLRAIF